MASKEYPYPWTAPPLVKNQGRGWWGNAKSKFLRPWRKRSPDGSPKEQSGGKRKPDKISPRRKRSADELPYVPKTQEQHYFPGDLPEIPIFAPRFTHLSPFQLSPEDDEGSSSSESSSSSMQGEFEIQMDNKPVRPLLSNIFPIYDSPTVTTQKPEATDTDQERRRHSTGTTIIEKPTSPTAQPVRLVRPSSAQSTTSSSSEHSSERRQRRASAVRALPVLPKRDMQRRFSPPPATIKEETDSDYYPDSPTEFPSSPLYINPQSQQIPARNNYAYHPWPPEKPEDVFSPEVYQKLQSSSEKNEEAKGGGRWGKKKSKGKEENKGDEIKGFDSFMMY